MVQLIKVSNLSNGSIGLKVQGFNLYRISIGSECNWFKLLIESRVQLDSARVILVQVLNWFKLSIDSIGLRVQLVDWLQWFNWFQVFKDSIVPMVQGINRFKGYMN